MANNALPLPFPYVPGEQTPDSFEDRAQQNFDALAIAIGEQQQATGWQAQPTLQNSWSQYSTNGGYAIRNGILWMRGEIQAGTVTAGTLLFTLPSPPTERSWFPVQGNSGSHRTIAVNTDGTVVTETAFSASEVVNLAPINYPVG